MRLRRIEAALDLHRINLGVVRAWLLLVPVLHQHCNHSSAASVFFLMDERNIEPHAATLRKNSAAEAQNDREPLRQALKHGNVLSELQQ
jgi:hypothetical protein